MSEKEYHEALGKKIVEILNNKDTNTDGSKTINVTLTGKICIDEVSCTEEGGIYINGKCYVLTPYPPITQAECEKSGGNWFKGHCIYKVPSL